MTKDELRKSLDFVCEERDKLQKRNEELEKVLHKIHINGVEEENTSVLDLMKENNELLEETYELTQLWKKEVEKRRKVVEYIKEHNMIVVNKEYLPDGISTAYDYELMNILEGEND